MKTLILPIGLPRSGKTTFCRAQDYPIVSPDSIRLALHGERYKKEAERMVWTIAEIMVKSLFIAGHEKVIVDATNIKKFDRDGWKNQMWIRQFVQIDTDMETCINRARSMDDNYIIPIILHMQEVRQELNLDLELTAEEKDFYAQRS